jgi:hypothetical protein
MDLYPSFHPYLYLNAFSHGSIIFLPKWALCFLAAAALWWIFLSGQIGNTYTTISSDKRMHGTERTSSTEVSGLQKYLSGAKIPKHSRVSQCM